MRAKLVVLVSLGALLVLALVYFATPRVPQDETGPDDGRGHARSDSMQPVLGASLPAGNDGHGGAQQPRENAPAQPQLRDPAQPYSARQARSGVESNAAASGATPRADGGAETMIEEQSQVQRVSRRVDELLDLAMNDDSDSLTAILAELENRDKDIRTGALDAVIQFADRAAIPHLRELAERTLDSAEKARLLEAADFLELPSLTEVMARRRAETGASMQTNPPASAPAVPKQ